MNTIKKFFVFFLISGLILSGCGPHVGLDGLSYTETFHPAENMVRDEFEFNGYTTWWHGTSQEWTRYGNLFKTNGSGALSDVIRSKYDIAGDLGIDGLVMQEGFLNSLLKDPYVTLERPSEKDLEDSLKDSNVLVTTDPGTETGTALMKKYVRNAVQDMIDENIAAGSRVNAYVLENGSRKLFVISSADTGLANKVRRLIAAIPEVLKDYDLRRGWFGAQTLINSVTVTPGHPLEVIGKGMNEGNSWFVFDGYMEFLSKQQYQQWMEKARLPVVTDVGYAGKNSPSFFGCRDYDSLQVQSIFTHAGWVDYAHAKSGYAFRDVYDTLADVSHAAYDGYIAGEGNKEQIDSGGKPFVSGTGTLESGAVPCMVLFTKKGEPFMQKTLWEAILDRRAVAVLEKGMMMGPALYRNALEMLLLDRVFLEEYFGDRVGIEATTKGYELQVTLKNTYSHDVAGKLSIVVPPEMGLSGDTGATLSLAAGDTKSLTFQLHPGKGAMNSTTPIAIHYNWGSGEKSTLTMLELPPAISVHHLLFAQGPVTRYPVTIHNFSSDSSFPVTVQVLDSNAGGKAVYEAKQTCPAATGSFRDLAFDLQTPPGNYFVKVSALGTETVSQLGVRKATGSPTLKEVDLNNDGINEYVMENDSVKATLLTTGARIIEYIVKSKNDNILFKLWPEKPVDSVRSFRKREFYPYGGFEDFLGQPSIETSKNYDAVITKKEGDHVQVKMTADYYGNKIEKTFTLYGNSPLLEIRYALTFKNPELNMIGPQPILSVGKDHGPEDRFVFPEIGGMRYVTMDQKRYFGRIIHLKEGWNAAYDTKENITFVGAFPVDQPLFLHMWMNHPSNPGSKYFYAELQPWTRIFQKSTMYFSYYLWASEGAWENGVKALRDRHLITVRK